MSNKKSGGSNFLVQGSILAMASIISRIIGLIYRIPMNRIIGDVGIGYYSTAFEIYNVMLIISSYSLPLAVSKLVSSLRGKGQKHNTYLLLKGAFLFAAIMGTLVSVILFFGAKWFANALETPEAWVALKVLSPCLLIVAILGVIRGFFQGLGSMMPSAISQIIEQIVNAIVSVWAAAMMFSYGKRVGAVLGNVDDYSASYGAAGGTMGTLAGAVAGLIFVGLIFALYMVIFKRQLKKERNYEVESFGYVMKIIVITIIPVLLSTTVYNISGLVEQFLFKKIAIAQGYSSYDIKLWWGVFAGKYKLMVNVPIAIASAMAASSVPSLTKSFTEGNMKEVHSKLHHATRLVMVIAFPCTIGLGVLAKPIFAMLFPSTINTLDLASMMMYIGAIAVIFYSLSTLSNGLLQGINRLSVPVINAVVALIVHAILLVILMLIFRLNIYAVIISNAFFAFLMCILNQAALSKYSGYRQEFGKTFFIPFVCSVIMGVITFLINLLIYTVSKSYTLSCVVSIVVAVVVYFVTLLLFKGVDESDLLRFPKGTLLVKIAKKTKLLR